MFLHEPRECVEVTGPHMRSKCSPFRSRGTCGANGSVDVGNSALRDRGQLLATRGIDCVEIFSCRGRLPRSADEESKAAVVALEPGSGFFGIFGSGSVLQADEFFGNAHIRLSALPVSHRVNWQPMSGCI